MPATPIDAMNHLRDRCKEINEHLRRMKKARENAAKNGSHAASSGSDRPAVEMDPMLLYRILNGLGGGYLDQGGSAGAGDPNSSNPVNFGGG